MFHYQCKRLVILILFIYVLHYLIWRTKLFEKNKYSLKEDIPNINIVDLSRPLLPNQTYGNIRCRLSAEIHVRVTLCIHNIENDKCITNFLLINI